MFGLIHKFSSAAVVLGLSAIVSTQSATAAEVIWNFTDEYQKNSVTGEAAQFFAKRIDELSGGKMKIVLHHGGSLGYKSKDNFDAVGDGAVEAANSFTGAWQGYDRVFMISLQPFVATSIDEAKTLYEVVKASYDDVFTKNNQKLLYTQAMPPSGIWGKKPLNSVSAIKNLKIRTYDPNGTKTFKAAGSAPIQLSWADVVPQLATGGIDAVLTSAESGTKSSFWEHLNHFTVINYAMAHNLAHVNLDAYNKLSADLKKVVDQAAADTQKYSWNALVTRSAANYKKMRENGVTIVEDVSKDYLLHLNKSGQVAVNDWLEDSGEKGAKLLAKYNGRVGR